MNIRTDRFLILAEHFERAGEIKGDMNWWWIFHNPVAGEGAGGERTAGEFLQVCGTTACLAGTAVSLFMPETVLWVQDIETSETLFNSEPHPADLAKKILGLTSRQSNILFYTVSWSSKWEGKYRSDPQRTMGEICRSIAESGSLDFLL